MKLTPDNEELFKSDLEELDRPDPQIQSEAIVINESDMEKFVLMMLVEEAGRQLIEMEAKLNKARICLKGILSSEGESNIPQLIEDTLEEIE